MKQMIAGFGLGIALFGFVWAADAQAAPVEDGLGWDCRLMGNHVCGPYNEQGAVPGRYENGELIVPWSELVVIEKWTGDRALGA